MAARVIVCGGAAAEVVREAMDRLQRERGVALVIHSADDSAGWAADDWAEARGIPCKVRVAWHDTMGGSAMSCHNDKLLEEQKPDGVIAFEPLGKQAEDLVMRAERDGVKVWRLRLDPGHRKPPQG